MLTTTETNKDTRQKIDKRVNFIRVHAFAKSRDTICILSLISLMGKERLLAFEYSMR